MTGSRRHGPSVTLRPASHSWTVGLDGSLSADGALAWATSLAAERDERVRPVVAWHVPLPIAAMSGRRAIDVDRMGLRAQAEVFAHDAIGRLPDSSRVDPVCVYEGHPAHVLESCAGPETALVVGRRGVGELKHRVVGWVSRYLATHAAGPVIVVPEGWSPRPTRSIVVGFDGSEYSQAALAWALEIAPPHAEVRALVAVDVIPWLRPELVLERHPDEIAAARHRINAAADAVDPPDSRASREFVIEGPRRAFTQALESADLVVVGPRGIGGLARMLLGSVTTWLLHESPCPVAVIPSA
jgi:nucleotide-binding universal stress UspA family protein